jgi:uncharacterized protein YidB (DUF937 family)
VIASQGVICILIGVQQWRRGGVHAARTTLVLSVASQKVREVNMGILNTVESMAEGQRSPQEYGKVANSLAEELRVRGGISGLMQAFQRNGAGGSVEQWSAGNTQPNPAGIENGLAGSGIIESISQHTGLSANVVREALAVIVPRLVHHMVSNNHLSPTGMPRGEQPEPGGVLQSIVRRII